MPPTIGYLTPPTIPSLNDCFPCCSVDIRKYLLYSSALSQRARWRTSLVILLSGAGVLSLFTEGNDHIFGVFTERKEN
jgi:hypothetical protein